jgi:precorrin-6Y C5,15-methyltransferase (decarboxylating)
MNTVAIVGMGLSVEDLPGSHLSMISGADILIGGKRHLEAFCEFKGKTRLITRDLPALSDYIRSHMEGHRIVVLASGDPLYYGIGGFLINALGKENVSIHPNVSSVAGAFARIKTPWQDAYVTSLHGRKREQDMLDAVKQYDKVAVFTDPDHTPAWIALSLLKNDIDSVDMWVAEQMGSKTEKVQCYDLETASKKMFNDPNMVILIQKQAIVEKAKKYDLCLGIPDTWLAHERGMITKPEVRVISLSKLRLKTHHILWDLGAGSGSVSVEAALFIKQGRIIAVEKNPHRIEQMKSNKTRFNINNMEIVSAKMPEGLNELPPPDRVFIGGGGENLKLIIQTAAAHLRKNGIIVINSVLLSSLETAVNTLQSLHFETEFIQVQVNVGKKMPQDTRLEARNPVWIVTGQPAASR